MKKCCSDCVEDMKLMFYIEKNGVVGECNYCLSKEDKCIALDDVIFKQIFEFISKAYVKKTTIFGRPLYNLVQKEWKLFGDNRHQIKIFKDLCEIYDINIKEIYDYAVIGEKTNNYIMLWEDFKQKIKHENRFNVSLPQEIIGLIGFQSKNTLYKALYDGTIIYRARKDFIIDESLKIDSSPTCIKKMVGMPPKEQAKSGRANPEGIPYLYLANNLETAIAEVRPWIGVPITVAKFELTETVMVINFSSFHERSILDYLDEDVESSLNRLSFFLYLGEELSTPTSLEDSYLDYLPTQYLAEVIKNQGYQGIIYDSSLGNAQNIVLFNQDCVEVESTELHVITHINYGFNYL